MNSKNLAKWLNWVFSSLISISLIFTSYYIWRALYYGDIGGTSGGTLILLVDIIMLVIPAISSIYSLILVEIQITDKIPPHKSFAYLFCVFAPWFYWVLYLVALVSIASQ